MAENNQIDWTEEDTFNRLTEQQVTGKLEPIWFGTQHLWLFKYTYQGQARAVQLFEQQVPAWARGHKGPVTAHAQANGQVRFDHEFR